MGIPQVQLFQILTALCLICVVVPQFMPGTSPGTPNHSLDTCQKRAGIENVTSEFNGLHAPVIGKWCSGTGNNESAQLSLISPSVRKDERVFLSLKVIYKRALLCLNNLLPIEEDTNDWYLSLVYDYDTAVKMSQSVCTRLSILRNLSCVDEGIPRVMKCMRWTTQTAIAHFYRLHNASIAGTDNHDTAEIYGCLISAGTGNCFRRQLTTCPKRTRKLLYDYYMMLSGRCKQIAAIHSEKSKTNDTTDDTDLGLDQTTKAPVVRDDSRAESDKAADTTTTSTARTEKITTTRTVVRSSEQPRNLGDEKTKFRSRNRMGDTSKSSGDKSAANVCLCHIWMKSFVLSISLIVVFIF